MARMLAKPKEDGTLEARPAGFALAVMGLGTPDKKLFEEGAMVLTSGVLIDGVLGYVAADKDGVFVIQPGTVQPKDRRLKPVWLTDDELRLGMRSIFDSAGKGGGAETEGSHVNFRLNMSHPQKWESTTVIRLEGERAKTALIEAARESEKAPFISSRDAKTTPLEIHTSQQLPPAVNLGSLEF